MSLTFAVVFIVVHVVLLYCVAYMLSGKLYAYKRKQYDKMLERRKKSLDDFKAACESREPIEK